jgi:hypothetical protein
MSEPGKKRREEALKNRTDAPETRRQRHEAHADAAGHQDVEPARLGAELAAEDRPRDETETADALKRSATENVGP